MVTALDVVKMAMTQYGHPYSNGYDSLNGTHPWSYWCESFTESTHRNLGLDVIPQVNAVSAGRYYDLSPGRAPLGAVVYWNENFYSPDGHTAISLGNGACLGTVTDGTGVGIMWWNETTVGYMGWNYLPGVEEAVPPDPPMNNWYEQPGNPYNVEGQDAIGIGGGFLRFYETLGVEPMVVLGFALAREEDMIVTDSDASSRLRTVQRFERGTLIYQGENPFPSDVVMKLESSVLSSP